MPCRDRNEKNLAAQATIHSVGKISQWREDTRQELEDPRWLDSSSPTNTNR
jgi:hypothetical protein